MERRTQIIILIIILIIIIATVVLLWGFCECSGQSGSGSFTTSTPSSQTTT